MTEFKFEFAALDFIGRNGMNQWSATCGSLPSELWLPDLKWLQQVFVRSSADSCNEIRRHKANYYSLIIHYSGSRRVSHEG